LTGPAKLSEDITDKTLLTKRFLMSIRKIATSTSSYNIYNEAMNIPGLSGHVNGEQLLKIIQVGISECGHWMYYWPHQQTFLRENVWEFRRDQNSGRNYVITLLTRLHRN